MYSWYLYPKSGNTWTRFLIANLLHPSEPATFTNIDRLIPQSEELSKRELDRVPRPRIMKSHQYYRPQVPSSDLHRSGPARCGRIAIQFL